MRPTKYSQERADAICATLAEGNTIRVAALVNGIGVSTLNEWREKYPEFAVALTRAEAEAEREHAQNIRRAALLPENWQASKFWLTHRSGSDWKPPAETRRVGGDPDNPTPLVVERVVFGGSN